jgi:hypothetical protein
MAKDFEPDVYNVIEGGARERRKVEQAGLMYLLIGALHNKLQDDGYCGFEAGSPTADVIAEIVKAVEGWA